MRKFLQENILYIAWATAVVAVFGSLYFSEVLRLPPCVLCWYQRILMYPLVVIMGVGIFLRNRDLPFYVLPFSITGAGVALYHYFLQIGAVPEKLGPCAAGVSCTAKLLIWFNFATIPFLSLIAFLTITAAMVIYQRLKNHNE